MFTLSGISFPPGIILFWEPREPWKASVGSRAGEGRRCASGCRAQSSAAATQSFWFAATQTKPFSCFLEAIPSYPFPSRCETPVNEDFLKGNKGQFPEFTPEGIQPQKSLAPHRIFSLKELLPSCFYASAKSPVPFAEGRTAVSLVVFKTTQSFSQRKYFYAPSFRISTCTSFLI